MTYKKLLLAALLISSAYAETITLHTPSITGEQAPELRTATQSAPTTALAPAVPQEKTVVPSTCNKRRNGIIAGAVSFIGLSVLTIIGFVISCIP